MGIYDTGPEQLLFLTKWRVLKVCCIQDCLLALVLFPMVSFSNTQLAKAVLTPRRYLSGHPVHARPAPGCCTALGIG